MSKMIYTSIPGIDKPVAKLAMGSMIFTTRDDVTGCQWMEQTKDNSFRLLDEAFELGYNTIDTARGYAGGDSERSLGEWMKSRGVRDKIFFVNKGCAKGNYFVRNSPELIIHDIIETLDVMQMDYSDIYMCHRDNPDVPVEEIVDAFAMMQRLGYIHGYGGSNWLLSRTKRAVEYAKEKGYPPFIAAEPGFSLAVPVTYSWSDSDEYLSQPEFRENYEYYRDTKLTIFTWSSMARGFWSGLYDRETCEQYRDTWDKTCIKAYWGEDNWKRMDRVKELSKRIGASVPNIALAYLLNQPLDIHPIIGANTKEDCISNLQALDIKLDQATLDWLSLESDERPW